MCIRDRAYNDASNLRTVPATYNRARNSADAILDDATKGVDSKEWKDWVDGKMRFDVGKDYPAYDPDVHGVDRSSRTTDVAWTAGVTREGLKFDDPIKTMSVSYTHLDVYKRQTYNSAKMGEDDGGAPGNPVIVRWKRVAGASRPVLQGGVHTFKFERADHVVFEGFEVRGGSSTCVFSEADDIVVRDAVIHACPSHGILGADQNSGSFTLEYLSLIHI